MFLDETIQITKFTEADATATCRRTLAQVKMHRK